MKKWARRNKATFAAGTAVLSALCVGFGLSTWFFLQERDARQEAEREKNEEIALLAKVEASENIARAALDWDAGQFPEAAALVLKISPDNLYPSLQAAQVYRDILAWYAMHEQWQDAAHFLGGLLRVDQYRNYNSPAAIWDLLEAGDTLVEIGDPATRAQYEQFRQEAIRRSADTAEPLAAERLIRASLLLPANQDTVESLDLPARTVENSFSSSAPGVNSSNGEAPWRWVALALMEYRRGHWAEAVQRCQSFPAADTNPARIAAIRLILAMSWQGLGKSGEAVSELQRGRELTEAKFHTALTAGRESEGYWFDWAMVQILLREASGLIQSAPGS
jgi:hypothetical protein